MAKLTALVFFLVAAAALASASAYSMEGRCQREMQQMGMMRQCMNYMQSKMRSPFRFNRSYQEEHLQECCNELQQFSSECVCDVVSQMTRMMPQYGQMERMACNLPRMCGMMDCGSSCGSGSGSPYY